MGSVSTTRTSVDNRPEGRATPRPRTGTAAAASRDALREVGLRVTPQRLAVLEALNDAGGEHLSADDVWQHLSPRWSLDRSTAYRVLSDLTEAGLLTQVRFADGIARFEVQSRAHHHATCTLCGSTEDVPVELLGPLTAALAQSSGFALSLDEPLTVRGVCHRCARQSTRAPEAKA